MTAQDRGREQVSYAMLPLTPADLWLLARTVGGVALVLLFLRWYEPRMLYYPQHPERRVSRIPADAGMAYEAMTLTASDNVRLSAWWLPAPENAPEARPAVLFLHGNAGNIGHRLEKARVLLDLGFDVLLLDYRGYGDSEGRPSEKGTYRDADAAYSYLTGTRGVNPRRILLYGESLGTGVAVDLASRMPVGGVVLEAPFTSISDVAQRIFWFLPGVVRLLVRNRYDSRRKIARIDAPLLLLHSRDDEFFSFRRHAERLFAAAREPKRLVELRGTHADSFFVSEPVCRDALREFAVQISRHMKHTHMPAGLQ
jgi:hypothetical protein